MENRRLNMKKLLDEINKMKKSPICTAVAKRSGEFRSIDRKDKDAVFNELCFCLMTANFNAQKSIAIQQKIGNGFMAMPQEELEKELINGGHRFPKARSSYIIEARKHYHELTELLEQEKDERVIRDWLVKNVKGLGMKESSHFLRNIGYGNVAIIDFHIIDLLERERLIVRPKSITPKKYLEIEQTLERIAESAELSLGELDLYLWCMETGKILK
jgi:N-glycosylase/DNA lyase